ncbi:MAG: DUF4296 domain-containing protein [Chitinophagales bacterium]
MRSAFSGYLNIVYASIIFVFISCRPGEEKAPSGILPKDKMIAVLFDIHVAESSVNSRGMTNIQLNQLVSLKYEDVMKKNGTTYAIFKDSFDYYLHHPDQFEEIYQEIVNQLTAMEGKVKARQPVLKKDGVDSIKVNSSTP